MNKQEILNTIFNKLVDEKHWNKHCLDLELMNHVAEIVEEMQVKKLNIQNVSKCQHPYKKVVSGDDDLYMKCETQCSFLYTVLADEVNCF